MDGADLFVAGLYEVFGAINDLGVPVLVHGGDIAGAEPAVFSPAMCLIGRFMIARGDPRAAHFNLARSDTIPRNLSRFAIGTFRAHQANLNEGCGPTLFGADFILFVVGPVAHVGPESARGADGSGLGHAPEMFDLQAETVEAANELQRRGGASADDADGSVEFPAAGIFLERFEDGDPDGGNAASDGYALADHQAQHALRIDIGPGKNETRAEHGSCERNHPSI